MTTERELNSSNERTGESRRYQAWSVESIEREAAEFYKEHGMVTQQALKELGHGPLARAISRKYPGGIKMLRANLAFELEVPRDSNGNVLWYQLEPQKTKVLIEAQAYKFLAENGQLNQPSLRASGRRDLLGAIENHYPGGLSELRDSLKISGRKSKNYFTPERIEREASDFFNREGTLTRRSLYEKGRADLANAIFRKYQGGLRALKERLSSEEPSFAAVLKSYEQAVESGLDVKFEDFLRGEK